MQPGAFGAVAVAANERSATFTYTPTAGNVIGTGPLFAFNTATDGIQLKGLSATRDSNVTMMIELIEPATSTLIDSASTTILSIKQATNTVITRGTVGVNVASAAGVPARTRFVAGTNATDYVSRLGLVSVNLNDFSADESGISASINDSGNVANDDGADHFVVAVGDAVDLELTTVNGAAFMADPDQIQAAGFSVEPVTGACPAAIGANRLTVDETNSSLFTGTVTLTAPMINAAGEARLKVCGYSNGVTALEQETIQLTAQYNPDAANTRSPDEVTGALAALAYNGAVVQVNHINPASNPNQQSYLRITNTGPTSLVRITGVDDAGAAGASATQFTLASGASVQLNSQDLENGNAEKGIAGGFGAGTGKWRVTVTAPSVPAGGIRVQNFLRNNTSAGMVNTNVNNEN